MRSALFAALLLAMPWPAVSSEQPRSIQEHTNIDGIVSAVSAYFPRVQATVRSASGDRVSIDAGRKQGLLPGMRLALWREGRELRNPATGAVIGREEHEIGSIEISAVEESSSSGVVIGRTAEPAAGDLARITPRRINLAVIPVRTDHPELLQSLVDRLNDSGRFSVLNARKRDAFLSNRALKDSELVKEMGRAFGLDAAVTVEVYPSDGAYLLTARIFHAKDARLLDTVAARLKIEQKKGVLGAIRPHFSPTRAEVASSHDLPLAAMAFSAGDLDADGLPELVLTDGEKLYVYRQEASGWRPLWAEPAGDRKRKARHLFVDAADINGNGKPEIFAAALLDGEAVTLVLEAHDGGYSLVAELPGLFRVIAWPGHGLRLIGRQRSEPGAVRQFSWNGSSYAAGDEFLLPEGVGMYDFVLADFGGGAPFLVGLDYANRLAVFAGGRQVWTSGQDYPSAGATRAVPGAGRHGEPGKMTTGRRLASADLDGDGRDEIIVARNKDHSFFRGGYTKAELAGMSWSGSMLEQAWGVQDISGAVLDLQHVRGAAVIKALVFSPGGIFARDAARVLTFPVQ